MDRDKPALARLQLNFIDYLVIPLFGSMKPVLPNIADFITRLEENRKRWVLIEADQQNSSQ